MPELRDGAERERSGEMLGAGGTMELFNVRPARD
jgi:hypothetical protein